YDVVAWAERHGRLEELVRKIAAAFPDNPEVREALRHVDDPELIETRRFARFVPFATWLLNVVSAVLALVVIKVWWFNLIDTVRLVAYVVLACTAGYAAWILYKQITCGPVRTDAGVLLLQRLLAHSRLARRDWVLFAMSIAAAIGLGTIVSASPGPVEMSLTCGPVPNFQDDYVFGWAFANDPTQMAVQCKERDGRTGASFRCSSYRVDLYIGRLNKAQTLAIALDLKPPKEAATLGVAFSDIALDRSLNEIIKGSAVHLSETHVDIPPIPISVLNGSHTFLLTLQRLIDGQPPPDKVIVHV